MSKNRETTQQSGKISKGFPQAWIEKEGRGHCFATWLQTNVTIFVISDCLYWTSWCPPGSCLCWLCKSHFLKYVTKMYLQRNMALNFYQILTHFRISTSAITVVEVGSSQWASTWSITWPMWTTIMDGTHGTCSGITKL